MLVSVGLGLFCSKIVICCWVVGVSWVCVRLFIS